MHFTSKGEGEGVQTVDQGAYGSESLQWLNTQICNKWTKTVYAEQQVDILS